MISRINVIVLDVLGVIRIIVFIIILICRRFFLFLRSLILDINIEVQLYIALFDSRWFLLYLVVVCAGFNELYTNLVSHIITLQHRVIVISTFCLIPDVLAFALFIMDNFYSISILF